VSGNWLTGIDKKVKIIVQVQNVEFTADATLIPQSLFVKSLQAETDFIGF
jgi:hypothetical protein